MQDFCSILSSLTYSLHSVHTISMLYTPEITNARKNYVSSNQSHQVIIRYRWTWWQRWFRWQWYLRQIYLLTRRQTRKRYVVHCYWTQQLTYNNHSQLIASSIWRLTGYNRQTPANTASIIFTCGSINKWLNNYHNSDKVQTIQSMYIKSLSTTHLQWSHANKTTHNHYQHCNGHLQREPGFAGSHRFSSSACSGRECKGKGKRSITVCKKPSLLQELTCWNHTMLPATRQRWHSHLYPSQLKLIN